ncbi:DUF6838 family protein [Fructilactobacillus vespulae]|uniref:phage tail terminator family protein n=1 Tax=Fructilactobacillus vespulae TaxID=1249630 RepID=UPI0039B458D3
MMTMTELVGYTLSNIKPEIPVIRSHKLDGKIKFPSFFVQPLATQTQVKLSDEQMRKYNFDVVYLVDTKSMNVQSELDKMSEFMLSNLEWIVDKDGIKRHKVNDLSVEIQNEDLHISFSVNSRYRQGN